MIKKNNQFKIIYKKKHFVKLSIIYFFALKKKRKLKKTRIETLKV